MPKATDLQSHTRSGTGQQALRVIVHRGDSGREDNAMDEGKADICDDIMMDKAGITNQFDQSTHENKRIAIEGARRKRATVLLDSRTIDSTSERVHSNNSKCTCLSLVNQAEHRENAITDKRSIARETARIEYFELRYGVSRAIMDGLANRGWVKKYKFGFGRSGPTVYNICDMERYMTKFQGKRNGG